MTKNVNPTATECLNATQMRGLLRLGDVLIPGLPAGNAATASSAGTATTEGLPSFSESGCAAGADRMLAYMYEDDRAALLALTTVCAYAPRPLITAIVALSNANAKFPEPLAGLFRMANLGIKGIIHSLYYSNLPHRLGEGPRGLPNIHEAIGYNTNPIPRVSNPRN